MNGVSSFSGNLFALLFYYLEVRDAGPGVIVANAVFANCTGGITNLFFYCIFLTPARFPYVKKVAIFFWAGPFVDYVLFHLR